MKAFLLPASVLATFVAFAAPLPAASSHLAPTIRWDRNPEANVSGYRIYVGSSPGVYDQVFETGNECSYQLPAPDPNTAYFIAVAAYNTMGVESSLSAEVRYLPVPGCTRPVLDGEASVPEPLTFSASLPAGFIPAGPIVATWKQVSGPGIVAFSKSGDLSTSASFSLPGEYVVRVNITDGTTFVSDVASAFVADRFPHWLARNGISAEKAATPDVGGRTPLMNYALGMDAAGTIPTYDLSENKLAVFYSKNRFATDVDIIPEVAASPAGPWASGSSHVDMKTVASSNGVDLVRAIDLAEVAPARFLRLRFIDNPPGF